MWCAGALARDYTAMGGEPDVARNPNAPNYEQAYARVAKHGSAAVPRKRFLAIGDGMPTDVRGAAEAGIDLLYITSGIHAGEYGDADAPDPARLAAFLDSQDARPAAWMARLRW